VPNTNVLSRDAAYLEYPFNRQVNLVFHKRDFILRNLMLSDKTALQKFL